MFDIDGVLADFLNAYRTLQLTLGKARTYEPRWDAYWDEDVWAQIKNSDDFWARVPLLANAHEMSRINDLCYAADVYFVTNRPGRNVKFQTERWLRMKGIGSPTVVISAKKGEVAAAVRADVAIDDKAGNAVFTAYHSPRTRSFLLDAVYNQFDHGVLGSTVIRVKTVDAFLDEVIL